MKNQRMWRLAAGFAVTSLSLAACGSTSSSGSAGSGSSSQQKGSGTGQQSSFFNQADFDKSIAESTATPQGPSDQPWLQMINPTMVDTTQFKKAAPWNICFSNASVSNPWRVIGLKVMQGEAKLHPEIGNFNVVDAGGKDDKQISDLANMVTQKCDAIIVSPNTTNALTPAVAAACAGGIPIIDFDRGVTTPCPTTFIHPIGGYLYGYEAAKFVAAKMKQGGNVLALRILPGVDALETRWAAAKVVFDQANVNVVGVEFTGGDPAKTKQIVSNYIQRFGHIDAVWMDAGATTVAAAEAFEEAGQPIPPLTGEDQNDWLIKWNGFSDKSLGDAPTYPTYQWRTALIAATDILSGKQVPKEWILPQPEITKDNLSTFVAPNLPGLFYAMCGCQNMPGFPSAYISA